MWSRSRATSYFAVAFRNSVVYASSFDIWEKERFCYVMNVPDMLMLPEPLPTTFADVSLCDRFIKWCVHGAQQPLRRQTIKSLYRVY